MRRRGALRVVDINRKRPRPAFAITIVGGESTAEIDRLVREAIDEQRKREQG
jgi:hypothetical protein